MVSRALNAAERALAATVFRDSVDYDTVSISSVTIGTQVITRHFNGNFTIHWKAGYVDILGDSLRRSTLIHEMTHVWQGSNNGRWSGTYQVKSAAAQLGSGLRDAYEHDETVLGTILNWNDHRDTAYRVDAGQFGQPWTSFNVEQQGMIVQTWFEDEPTRQRHGAAGRGIFGASMSPYDARFPYIRDVIRGRNQNAPYRPVELPPGGDREIKSAQDKLVELGYLAPGQADGLIGGSHSATLDAVEAFQARNGLTRDRQLGGTNSQTRNLLHRPAEQLQPAHRPGARR